MASKDVIYNGHTYTLSYELVNPAREAVLLVLHGWGSNKEIMKQAFGKTLPEFRHIYLDMPGFGKSSNDTVLQTHDYRVWYCFQVRAYWYPNPLVCVPK